MSYTWFLLKKLYGLIKQIFKSIFLKLCCQGPRKCVGMRLAQLEMRVVVAAVLQSFSPVVCDKTVYPVNIEAFRMGAKDGLWVRFEAR